MQCHQQDSARCRSEVGTAWDIQPLPAYQYFENIRNFIVVIKELKLPSFEASDLQRDTLEVGSSAKVVDCVLALKNFYESQLSNAGEGARETCQISNRSTGCC